MKTTSIAFALCALLAAGACSKHETTTNGGTAAVSNEAPVVAQSSSLTPEQLGELGAEIKKNPNDAERLLAQRGLNQQSFEQAIRKVSEDPAAARRYSESYRKASA